MQNFLFANLPFERGEILFSKGFFVYTDIRKLQDKAKNFIYSNHRGSGGFDMSNSLAEVHPGLVSEWSEKNLPLTPDDITFGSNKKSMVERCL